MLLFHLGPCVTDIGLEMFLIKMDLKIKCKHFFVEKVSKTESISPIEYIRNQYDEIICGSTD